MKLRSMSATVEQWNNVQLRDAQCNVYTVERATVLKSYDSIVAVFDNVTGTLYTLPRFEYSVTTKKHVRAFCEDFCNCSPSIMELRKGEHCTPCIEYRTGNTWKRY